MNGEDYETIIDMLKKKINSPLTSSTGRLFDAVSVICGGPKTIRYEAQAAIEFMHKIKTMNINSYPIDGSEQKDIPLKPLIKNVTEDALNNIPVSIISSRFHKTFAKLLIHKTERIREETKINDVVLSGGVFQNEILLELMENELSKRGFNVFSHSKIPTNDGGISFGQVMIINDLISKGKTKVEFEL